MQINKRIRILQVSTILLITTGCGSNIFVKQPTDQQSSESARLQICLKELEGLETVVPAEHQKYRHEFDRLMQGAAQYASLRTMVGGETRHTVDALYQYKVNLLCAGISQRMLTGLAERGENA